MTATAYVKLTKAATIGGQTYQPGELVEIDRETMREILAKGLGVPAAGPGRRSLTSDPHPADVHPVVRAAR